MIRDCQIDLERLAPVRECMETYGMDDQDPRSEWPWNVISKNAVAYSCGAIARAGDPVEHCHDPNELALCRGLAGEAAQQMAGIDVGMGNEGSCQFRPFFVVANVGAPAAELSEATVRRAFGGTIYPLTRIVIEPLEERGEWWKSVLHWYSENDNPEADLRPWREMVRWFRSHADLRSPSFVMVGNHPREPGGKRSGCVFPRLALGVTSGGSLVGICGWTVHT